MSVSDGEPCPHCGEVPLEVINGSAECPNCGSVFDGDDGFGDGEDKF
ncbi:MAG: hypothetical protein O3A61_04285 [Actinomycetota bacterium]|nr:hypothetical protein [Actinomycetota bacterium]MDA2995557.1 hypothetical protein [Actinomycetota bacterium]